MTKSSEAFPVGQALSGRNYRGVRSEMGCAAHRQPGGRSSRNKDQVADYIPLTCLRKTIEGNPYLYIGFSVRRSIEKCSVSLYRPT